MHYFPYPEGFTADPTAGIIVHVTAALFVILFFYVIFSKKSYMEYIPGQTITCGNNSYIKILAFSNGELLKVDIDNPVYVGKREYESYFIVSPRFSGIEEEERPFGPMVLDMKGFIKSMKDTVVVINKEIDFKELYRKIKSGDCHKESYFDTEVLVVI